MEGVRLESVPCLHERVVESALYRIIRDLSEALERTPPTLTSHSLIEGSLKLALGAYESSRILVERCRGEGGGQAP